MKQKCLAGLLACVLLLTTCGQRPVESAAGAVPAPPPAARLFTDSAGRRVEVPGEIEKVAVSGPLAQILLFALCPEKMVGIAEPWEAPALEYLSPEHTALPVLGQLYGGKGEMNLESRLASGAQVVIDAGEEKEGVAEDLDALQAQTGIPFVHISATVETAPQAFRLLGQLLGLEERAEELAACCQGIYDRAEALGTLVEKKRVVYVTGAQGDHVIAQGSYHGQVLELLAENAARTGIPSALGTGDQVDMEQMMAWDPEVILFGPGSAYDAVGEDPAWAGLSAIRSGQYYEVPTGPYNWMGFPPAVQCCLGMLWLGKLLYPEAADYDLYEEVKTYYRLFYHWDLGEEQYQALVAHSIGKAEKR